MDFLPKWKTTLGALAVVLTGIALVVRSLSANDINFEAVMRGLAMAGAGFAAFGIGKKLDRNG